MKEQEKKSSKSSGKKNSKKGSGKDKSFNPFPLFFQVLLSIVLSFSVLAGGAGYAYYKLTGQVPLAQVEIRNIQGSETSFFDTLLKKNIKLNIVVLGVDEDGTRTDTIFVAHYDSISESIELLSVPRDTRVSPSDAVKEKVKSAGRSIPSVLKINEVHAYAGQDVGPECTVLQLEDLLGINVDHYVKVSTASFRALVDAVGGVDMYVPRNMYKNALEPNGGGIMINLKEGQQHLDGSAAEQLVRFRDYPEGDVERVRTQQLFMQALMSKILTTDSLLSNISNLINVAYEHIDTNLSISDALKYVNYINQVDLSRITTETIPGVGQYVGGISYYLHDSNATENVVQEIFFSESEPPADEIPTISTNVNGEEVEETSSKDLTILVSNGSGTNGLAGQFSDLLEEEGFTVNSPSTSNDAKKSKTVIYVKTENIGNDLLEYFRDAEIVVEPLSVGTGQDIHIVLGTSES